MPEFAVDNETDLSAARYFLRRRIAGDRWTPHSRARAVAALTILAEMIMVSGCRSVLNMAVVKRDNMDVVELSCLCKLSEENKTQVELITQRLEQVTNGLEVSLTETHVSLNIRVWETDERDSHE